MASGSETPPERLKGVGHYAALLYGTARRYLGSPRLLWDDLWAWGVRRRIALRGYLDGFSRTDGCRIFHTLFQWATLSQATVVFVALFGALSLVDFLDPFGLSRAVQGYSEGLFQKVSANFYGQAAQSRIAVVLVDERTLRSRGESWPPRYLFYSELVRRIARQQPAAIFLDVLVEDRRAYDETLGPAQDELQRALAQSGVPFFIGTLDERSRSVFAQVPGVRSTLVGWSGHERDYPLLVGPGHYFDDGAAIEPVEGGSCDSDAQPTAAFSLYRQLCADGRQAGCPAALAAGDTAAFCKAMVVQWGRKVSDEVVQRQLIDAAQCSAGDVSTWASLLEGARAFLATLSLGVDEEADGRLRQPCPYALTLRAEDLGTAKASGLLKDRVVMIGVDLKGIHDRVESPVHGQIPGVYLHAMALDNLLEWNAQYYQRSGNHCLQRTLAALVILLCVAILRARLPRESFLMRSVAIGALLIACLISYLWLRRPPVDWLGLLLVYELVKRLIEKHEAHGSQGGEGYET